MAKKCVEKRTKGKSSQTKTDTIAYRLKCAKTGNGLSHFVMYGDVPKEKSLL